MSNSRLISRFVFASGNAGKISEVRQILAPLNIAVVPQAELGVTPADETGATFLDNALLKARQAARASGLPAIADDSGLEVDVLHGSPGVRSARYAGPDATDEDNLDKLLTELVDVPPERRRAGFQCVAVLVNPDDVTAPLVAMGQWRGSILESRRGDGGFGYDPVFYDPDVGKSAAEMTLAEKNTRSHRGQAFRELAGMIAAQIGGGAR